MIPKLWHTQVLPALPGWYLLEPCWNMSEKERDTIYREHENCWDPIIAWAVSTHKREDSTECFFVSPITLERGDTDPSYPIVIRDPHGTISMPYVQGFENVDEAYDYLEEEQRKDRERRAKKI